MYSYKKLYKISGTSMDTKRHIFKITATLVNVENARQYNSQGMTFLIIYARFEIPGPDLIQLS